MFHQTSGHFPGRELLGLNPSDQDSEATGIDSSSIISNFLCSPLLLIEGGVI